MSTRTKFTVFIICVLIFIIGAPSVILYSRGYRFDIENKELTKTGGFFISIKPTRVNILLNNTQRKRTDLFFGSSFIKNLIPKTYNVKLTKENYHTWEKNLEVEEQTVTEINNISLIPKDPPTKQINNQINDLWFFPDKSKILLKEKEEDDWELKLYDLDKDLKSHLITEDDFSTSSVKILEVKPGPNSESALLKLGIEEQIEYHLLTIEPFPPKQKLLQKLTNKERVIFNPNNSQELIFKENKQIYVYDINNEKISYYYPDLSQEEREIVTFEPSHSSNSLIYLTSTGFIYNSYPGEKINTKPIDIEKETEYKLKESSGFVFLLVKENGELYAIDKETNKANLLDKKIKTISLSPHQDKLAYTSNFEIKLFYLRDQVSQPFNKKGDKVFISRFSKEISQLRWLNNHYLVFKANNTIKISEVDTRDKVNIINFLNFDNNFTLEWDPSNNNLLVYLGKELFNYKLSTF